MDLIQQIIDFIDPIYTLFYAALFASIVFIIVILVQLFILVFWKKVDGKIVETSIGEKEKKKGMRYFPRIKYEYSYGDMEYTGYSPWIMNEMHKSREKVQNMLDANPAGKTIKVLVNPFAANQSALIHDVNPFYLIFFFIGLLISGFFAVILYVNYNLTLF